MSRNDPCVCGSGLKQKKCHSDITPDSRAGVLLAKYAEIDNQITSYFEANVKRPPCHKGCVSCCYHEFAITAIEWKIIERELKQWPKEAMEKLRSTVDHQWEELKRMHPEYCKNLEENGTGHSKTTFLEQISMARESYNKPCPLLDLETGGCRVYNARPMACRLHGMSHFTYEEFRVCDLIPSNRENIEMTPDLTEYGEEMAFLSDFEFNGQHIRSRAYPIIYWLKLTFRNYDGQVNIPFESRDFRTPVAIAENDQMKMYNL